MFAYYCSKAVFWISEVASTAHQGQLSGWLIDAGIDSIIFLIFFSDLSRDDRGRVPIQELPWQFAFPKTNYTRTGGRALSYFKHCSRCGREGQPACGGHIWRINQSIPPWPIFFTVALMQSLESLEIAHGCVPNTRPRFNPQPSSLWRKRLFRLTFGKRFIMSHPLWQYGICCWSSRLSHWPFLKDKIDGVMFAHLFPVASWALVFWAVPPG